MTSNYSWQTRGAALGATLALIAVASCTDDMNLGRTFNVDAGPGEVPSFAPEAGADAWAEVPDAALAQCIAVECPAPLGTCPSSAFKCDVDFSKDDNNCGGCGMVCPKYDGFGNPASVLRMSMHCVDGACVPRCNSGYLDCNGLVDDGCEVPILGDTKNCGGCGVVCAPGVPCLDGVCGCKAPLVLCGGECKDVTTDSNNCGACGSVCEHSGLPTPPPFMMHACGKSECGKLICMPGQSRGDCDEDVPTLGYASNGCETLTNTVEHCGACNKKCKADESCINNAQTRQWECKPTELKCAANEIKCGSVCIDIRFDPVHCGGCGLACPAFGLPARPPNHVQPTCTYGVCGAKCDEGWADCDGQMANGCETDLARDPANCGACGVACDSSAGQPCVRGQCVTKPCDDERPTQ